LLVGRKVTFESMSMANWNRPTAKVYAHGADVGAAMVRAGMAWAFVRYSRDYVGLEEQARAAVLGVHAHDCEKRARIDGAGRLGSADARSRHHWRVRGWPFSIYPPIVVKAPRSTNPDYLDCWARKVRVRNAGATMERIS